MSRDRIFLLTPGFEDPARPGERFFCPYSNQVEGLLASFPELKNKLDIERLPFPRPRQPVIAQIGEENQSLPVLVLGDERGAPPGDALVAASGARFVNDTRRILELLAQRHGVAKPH